MSQGFDDGPARAILAAKSTMPGALLPILHDLQAEYGHVPDAVVPLVAEALNLSRAEVHGVTSFYHDFKRSKQGRYTIKVCQAESCQAMGSAQLTTAIKAQLGCDFHETTTDGNFSLEPVYCLGNCACSPNIMVDKQTYGRVSTASFKALTKGLASKAAGTQ